MIEKVQRFFLFLVDYTIWVLSLSSEPTFFSKWVFYVSWPEEPICFFGGLEKRLLCFTLFKATRLGFLWTIRVLCFCTFCSTSFVFLVFKVLLKWVLNVLEKFTLEAEKMGFCFMKWVESWVFLSLLVVLLQ